MVIILTITIGSDVRTGRSIVRSMLHCELRITMRDEARLACAGRSCRLYEPFVNALATFFQFALPPFQPEKPPVDNWQTSPWLPKSPSLGIYLPGFGRRQGQPLRLSVISRRYESAAATLSAR